MNEKELEKLVNGVGSMAELTALFFKSLVESGVDTVSAAHISGDFIKAIITSAGSNNDGK